MQSWLYPLLALVAGFAVDAYGSMHHIKWVYLYFGNVFLLLCLVVLTSAFFQFRQGKWLRGIAQLGLMGFLFMYSIVLAMFYPWDYYADDLKLPKNLSLEKPENLPIDWAYSVDESLDSVMELRAQPRELRIVNAIQPGIYRYYARVKLKQSGTVYLKAFEITHNNPLSPTTLKERTASKATAGVMSLHHQRFTIYEGDWGKPYAARFELWFAPEKPGIDHKLLEKNYLIEGWMR